MAYYANVEGSMMQVMTEGNQPFPTLHTYPVGAQLMDFIYYDIKGFNDKLEELFLICDKVIEKDIAKEVAELENENLHLRWYGQHMAEMLRKHDYRTKAGFAAICDTYPDHVALLRSMPQWANVTHKTATRSFFIGIFGLKALADRQQMQNCLEFCLNSTRSEQYRRLSPMQRLLVYEQWRKQQRAQSVYFDRELYASRLVMQNSPAFAPASSIEELSEQVAAANPTIREMVWLEDGPALQRFELMKLIALGIPVKRCAHCDRYFLPEGRSDMEYCSRPVKDQPGKTCQDIGALRKHEQKVRDNPIYAAHRKAYKRMNSRVRTGIMSQADFLVWSEQAREMREQCLAGNLPEAEFFDWLDRDRRYKKKD